MTQSQYLRFVFTLCIYILFLSTISCREAIKPAPDVGQCIKDARERGPPCTLDVQKDLPKPNQVQPLYLRPRKSKYWLPNKKGQLEISRGAIIQLYCTNSFANVTASKDIDAPLTLQVARNTRSINARCLHDQTFEWHGGGKHEFRHFVCVRGLPYKVEQLQQACANGTASLYRVGYNISGERFITTMELCHDAAQLQTHYAHFHLEPANVHFQRHVKRVDFTTAGHFDGYDMKALYSMRHQMQHAAQLLGVKEGTGLLLDAKGGMFLARGHLAAKADLIYASQQRSSFNYMNVAPQWQSFNGGQWVQVEDETRKFVARSGLSVSVYTGTWGVMPLTANGSNLVRDFYLAKDANNNDVLPVPRLFYRVLIDKVRPWRGIALVGVNNPYATLAQILNEYVICDTVHETVGWLSWLKNGNLKKGYLYACAVSDLAEAVAHLPPQLSEVHELLV